MPEKTKPTVFIFSTAYLPFLGGAETAIKGITDEISDLNFVILTARFSGDVLKEEKIGNAMVYRLGFGKSFDKFLLPKLTFLKFLRLRKKFSEPFIFWGMMASYSSVAVFFLKIFFPKIPFLLTLQEGDSEKHIRTSRLGLVGLWWRLLIKTANRLQVISNYLKNLAVSFGAKVAVDIVPNGVEVERFSNVDAEKTLILRQKLGIKKGEKIIITVSRLTHKNAVDVVIKALPKMRSKVRFLVLGEGEEKGTLSKLVSNLGLDDRVIFAGSDFDNLPNYLHLASVFVRPSRSEGLGTAFLEAMAAGVPVVASSAGGIKDFLKDEETGLEVKIDDPEDLAEKLDLILSDEALRQRLISNGKKLVKEKYQWSQIAGKMREIFKSLL